MQGGLLADTPNRAQAATTCLPLIACLYSSESMCLHYLGTLCRAKNFALILCTQADCAHQDHLDACIHVGAGIAHIGNHRLPPADGCHSDCCSRHLHTAATILTHIHHQALQVMSGTRRANNASTPVTNVRRNLPAQPAGECVNMQRARASQLQRSALRQVSSWKDPGDMPNQAVHGEGPAKTAAHLRGLQVLPLHSLEGVAQRLGQRAHEHILRLPQSAVFRPHRIALRQLLLRCACTKQLV